MGSKLPNFFIVGAAKSGTTSLHYYLKQHPDIYLPETKENFFFSGIRKNTFSGTGSEYGQVIVEDFGKYKKLFQHTNNEKLIGEVCVAYLYFYQEAISNIEKYLDYTPRIIIILRDPRDRAFSNYKHHVRDRIETLSFEKAIRTEVLNKRKVEKWWWGFQYIDVGFYYNQVNAYIDAFGREYVKTYLYEDLENETPNIIKDILNFLELDGGFKPDITTRHNVSNITRSGNLEDFLNRDNHPVKKFLRPIFLHTIGKESTEDIVNYFKYHNLLRLKSKTKKRLIYIYREDILKLEDLIKRDLSHWLR